MKDLAKRLITDSKGSLPIFTFLLCVAPLGVVAQTAQQKEVPPDPPPQVSGQRTDADETFELKIEEHRFNRENFEASTSVGLAENSTLNVQIGVGLTAGKIEVLLRNVKGQVRFRGTLGRILEITSSRRPPSPESPPN